MQSGTIAQGVYKQTVLLKKINQYQASQKLNLLDEAGYCHGLSLLWLVKMAERKEQWFYDMIRALVNATEEKLNSFNTDFEKFIAKIEFAQNPYEHSQHLFTNKDDYVRQEDIDKILELKGQINNNGNYTQTDLNYLTVKINNKQNAAVFSGGIGTLHSIALFYRDNKYYLYDANHESGQAFSTTRRKEITSWITKRLYTNFKDEVPEKMKLEVTLLTIPCRKLKRKAKNRAELPPAKRLKRSFTQTLFHHSAESSIAKISNEEMAPRK